MVNSKMKPVLDPRGQQGRPMLQLAPRVSMDDLRKGPILFYDNTKLGFVNYMTASWIAVRHWALIMPLSRGRS
jgi:hypothetical protein